MKKLLFLAVAMLMAVNFSAMAQTDNSIQSNQEHVDTIHVYIGESVTMGDANLVLSDISHLIEGIHLASPLGEMPMRVDIYVKRRNVMRVIQIILYDRDEFGYTSDDVMITL